MCENRADHDIIKEKSLLLTRDDRKISIISGLLLLGLTLTTGIAVYNAMRQQIESTLGRGLGVALQGKALLIESQVEKGVSDTRTLALRPFLIKSVQELNEQPDNQSAMDDLMRNVDSLPDAGFSAAIVYDRNGNTLAQTGQFSENQHQALSLNKYAHAFLIWDKQFVLRTSAEIFDQKKQMIGSITTEIKLPKLTRRFSEIRSIGNTGEFILCAPPAHKTRDMACLISQIDGIKFKRLLRDTNTGILPISYALDGQHGVIAVKDYRQVQVIEAYAPLKAIGLGMTLKLDESELFAPINQELRLIILYLAGLILGEILLLNWFVRKLINSERKAQHAKEIAEQFSIELSRKETELRERLKEITCLFEIRRSIGLELSVETVCQNIFIHLIPALQYPQFATAVIELDGWRYISGRSNLSLAPHVLTKEKIAEQARTERRANRDPACTCWSVIKINGKTCGNLRVFYPDDKPLLLQEEQKLVNAIATDLESWLERKQLEQTLISIAEEQAHTIGQELHDNVGQQIAAIGYQAQALEKKLATTGNDANMSKAAASIASQAQTAVIHIKQLARGLLPFELETNGLVFALRTLAERVTDTYHISCEFLSSHDIIIYDNNVALNLYRIAQEAVNNAIRHGQAQHITISLSTHDKVLDLSICDDGHGFSYKESDRHATSGMGLKIMQYRAKQLDAQLEILARSEGGTEVHLEKRII